MNAVTLTVLYSNAHASLSKEAINFLVQDTLTVVGPILAKMGEEADLSAKYRRGSASKDAEVAIVTRAAAKVGAHPLLQHLSFVQATEKSFAQHGHTFAGQNLPLTPGIRIRQAATAKPAKAPAPAPAA